MNINGVQRRSSSYGKFGLFGVYEFLNADSGKPSGEFEQFIFLVEVSDEIENQIEFRKVIPFLGLPPSDDELVLTVFVFESPPVFVVPAPTRY